MVPRAARTVWAVAREQPHGGWSLVVVSALVLVGLFMIRSLSGAVSTPVGERPEEDERHEQQPSAGRADHLLVPPAGRCGRPGVAGVQRARVGLLRSAGEVLHPEPGEVLWEAGDPYDLNLVLAGGVLLIDRRDDRVVFVVEAGDFVGELGMLMGQRAFLPGVAMEGTELLRVRVADLRRLVEISGELSDVLLTALDARRTLLKDR